MRRLVSRRVLSLGVLVGLVALLMAACAGPAPTPEVVIREVVKEVVVEKEVIREVEVPVVVEKEVIREVVKEVVVEKEEELQPVIIRMSADLPPPPHPTGIAMMWLREQLPKEIPGGEYRPYFAGALYKDPEAMEAMSEGNLETGWIVFGKSSAVDPWLGIHAQPGVLTSVGAMHGLVDLETGQMIIDRLETRHGIHVFGFADLSFGLGLAGKDPLRSLDQLKGKKIRTYAVAVNPVVESWGANPVVMSFGDVPSALQAGVLDGIVTSIGGWKAVMEQTPYYTIAGVSSLASDGYWVGASRKWWDSLNSVTREKVDDLIQRSIVYQDELNWCNDQFAIGEFRANTPADPGIYIMTAAESTPLTDAIGTSVADFLKERLNDSAASTWVDKFQVEGKASRAANPPGSHPLEKLDCSGNSSVGTDFAAALGQ